MKKYILVVFLLFVFVFSALVFASSSFPNFANSGGGNWATGYYRSIKITNSTGSALTDYCVKITLTTATLGNPYANIKADGSDIRFALSDKYTELINYWIESWDNAGDSIVWVKIPPLPAGDSFIYMYYGNVSATAVSSATDTFVFYDDFSTDTRSNYSVAMFNNNGTLSVTQEWSSASPSYKREYTNAAGSGQAFIYQSIGSGHSGTHRLTVRAKVYCSDGFLGRVCVGVADQNTVRQAWDDKFSDGYVFRTSFWGLTNEVWYTFNLNGSLSPDTTYYYGTYLYDPTSPGYYRIDVDYAIIRKYASPEPTVSSPGAEVDICSVSTTNWTNLLAGAKAIAPGNPIAYVKFDMKTLEGVNNWKRFRVDKHVFTTTPIPDSKIQVQLWCEKNNNGRWDKSDTFISKGNFVNGTVYLNMRRWVVNTTSRTYYIVFRLDKTIGGGQRAGVGIAGNNYFEFENALAIGVPP